ncbi:hypothetical protein [Paenibacillus roseipurpureus]|uniref:Uncharacterized protein n=1 Tax=Paenibacillus roseopurpureus TaxID=2918901 RepID=A0AA96RNJ2_9BACL|nr:hypothetical protein [Paenibacillus sp. MBLB1832]WNR45547.1 hypothetical protein MJB10_05430 [Paenibacillus sp. MBLB1832]
MLKNEELEVRYEPPSHKCLTSRFDRTGFITQVTDVRRGHTYCSAEHQGQGNARRGGVGLCNEFSIHRAVGYETAQVGQPFPKLGVGLVTRAHEREYMFHEPYVVQPFPISWDASEDRIEVSVEPLPCRGYEARLHKRIVLRGRQLCIDYTLQNAGTMAIITEEYAHNFLRMAGREIGPDYEVVIPDLVGAGSVGGPFVSSGRTLNWSQPMREGEECYLSRPIEASGATSAAWELHVRQLGIGLMEEVSGAAVSHFALWGKAHVISPELFISIQLEPGQVMNWQRVYSFY